MDNIFIPVNDIMSITYHHTLHITARHNIHTKPLGVVRLPSLYCNMPHAIVGMDSVSDNQMNLEKEQDVYDG